MFIQPGHQRKHAQAKEHRGGERAEKTQTRPYADDQIGRHNRPRDESGGFVKIVDRAAFQRKPAFDHGRGVKGKRQQEEQVVDAVVLPEPFSPKENRVNDAEAIDNHSHQKILSVGEPSHRMRLIQTEAAASRNSGEATPEAQIGGVQNHGCER